MENKEIIIDGVNVSGCINYTDELKGCSCRLTYAPFHYRFCEQNPNCYYKQLKRKEQECEKLKKQLFSFMNGDYCKNGYSLKQQLDKLKTMITEIKEICKNNDELQGDFNVVDCDKYKLGKHNLANKILKKLSECEVKNERN